jgi:septal ring factor EnvC (AmiA/AmiB activator)
MQNSMYDKALPSLPLWISGQRTAHPQVQQSTHNLNKSFGSLEEENRRLREELARSQESVRKEKERAASALREQSLYYRRKIDQQNFHIARIANTIREVFASCSDDMRHEQDKNYSDEEIQVYGSF